MFERIIGLFKKTPKALLVIFAAAFIILQAFADYATGDLSLLIFDLAPIFIVTWFAGMYWGIFISLVSASSWLVVDMITTPVHANPFTHYWNVGIKIAFFFVLVYVFSQLKKTLAREKDLARVDFLTGALNNRSFCEAAIRELDISRRHNRPITLAYLDMDNFKDINDRFGHNTGSLLLQLVVESIKKNLRSSDIIARMGGDEFAIIFPETPYEPAKAVINRIRFMLIDITRRKGWPATFSMGVVTYAKPSASIDEMVKKADGLMYAAKNAGKNTVRHEVVGE